MPHLQFIMTFPAFSCLLSQQTDTQTHTRKKEPTELWFISLLHIVIIFRDFYFHLCIFAFFCTRHLFIGKIQTNEQGKHYLCHAMREQMHTHTQIQIDKKKTKRTGKMESFKLMKSLDSYLIHSRFFCFYLGKKGTHFEFLKQKVHSNVYENPYERKNCPCQSISGIKWPPGFLLDLNESVSLTRIYAEWWEHANIKRIHSQVFQ